MIETILFVIITLVLGLTATFMGYPLFRILLPLWAFLGGLMLGVQGFDSFNNSGLLATSMGLFVGFFLGLFLAAISYYVYAFAILLWGAAMGYVLGQGLMLLIGFEYGFMTVLVGVIGAVLLGMLFYKGKMPKFFVIFATSWAGAMMVMTSVFVLLGKLPTSAVSVSLSRILVQDSLVWLIVWAIVAALGMVFQFAMVREAENVNDPFVIADYEAAGSKKSK